jgi:hypothetical protein
MLVKLTTMEMLIATSLGTARHMQSVSRTPTRGQSKESSLDSHILGAMGEIAAAKAMGIYPGFTINNFDGPDMGIDIQVRTSRRDKLIIAPHDKADQKYVLVTGNAPNMNVVGWIWGNDAKDDIWMFDPHNNRPPAYFVPSEALYPIEEIHAR